MAGRTLDERARLFEVRYPDKKLPVHRLRAIYRKQGIKLKTVRQVKMIPERNQP